MMWGKVVHPPAKEYICGWVSHAALQNTTAPHLQHRVPLACRVGGAAAAQRLGGVLHVPEDGHRVPAWGSSRWVDCGV
jgi:hypothetical protein